MKFILIMVAVAMLTATFSRYFSSGIKGEPVEKPTARQLRTASPGRVVGTDPGDIRHGGDLLTRAHSRGNDLAIFGAG